jgi:hypothetical protein
LIAKTNQNIGCWLALRRDCKYIWEDTAEILSSIWVVSQSDNHLILCPSIIMKSFTILLLLVIIQQNITIVSGHNNTKVNPKDHSDFLKAEEKCLKSFGLDATFIINVIEFLKLLVNVFILLILLANQRSIRVSIWCYLGFRRSWKLSVQSIKSREIKRDRALRKWRNLLPLNSILRNSCEIVLICIEGLSS